MKKINKGWKKWRIQKEELDEKNKVFIKLFQIENGKDLKIYETIIELNKSGGYFANLMVIILLLLYKY